jgi:hypothetical protein
VLVSPDELGSLLYALRHGGDADDLLSGDDDSDADDDADDVDGEDDEYEDEEPGGAE